MDPDRWRLLEAVFHAAATLTPADRAAYLRSTYPDEPGLAAEVERLLAAGERADRFISDVIQGTAGPDSA